MSEQNESEGEPMDQGAPSTSSAPKDTPLPPGVGMAGGAVGVGMKRTSSDGTADGKQRQQQRVQAQVADPHWVLEKQHVDSIINFLIRSEWVRMGWCGGGVRRGWHEVRIESGRGGGWQDEVRSLGMGGGGQGKVGVVIENK